MNYVEEMDTLQTMVADYRTVFPKESANATDAEIAHIVLCQQGIAHEYVNDPQINAALVIGGVRIY